MKSAEQLPPAEHKDIPEAPYSHTWERVFEPTWKPPQQEHKPHTNFVGMSASIPDTDMQALMEAAPFQDPATSREEGLRQRDRIADAVDALSPRLRWIFEARHYRGLSVREVGRELSLSKSYVDRLYGQAVRELQGHLADLVGER